jgi:hypothetical protein
MLNSFKIRDILIFLPPSRYQTTNFFQWGPPAEVLPTVGAEILPNPDYSIISYYN